MMANRPRLWVASELYYPEETSTGYFLTRIAEGLADEFDVHVISGRPTYSSRDVSVSRRESRHGVDIHRMAGTRFGKDRLLLRVVNLVSFSLAALIFAAVSFRRGDRVLVVTNPPTLPLCIAFAGKLRGTRQCLLVHDMFPEALVATGILRRESIGYRFLSAVFDAGFRQFDRVIVLGRDMAELAARKLKGDVSRLVTIPNWGDADEIDPAQRDNNEVRRELGLDGKFIIQFSGNIGRTHDLTSIMACAYAVRDRPAIAFVLAGFGGKLASAQREIARRGLANVHVLPRQPRERLSALLTCSDLTVIAFVSDMFGISVPSRMYNVMAAGVPIMAMADPRSELALTVSENGAGWAIAEGDVAGLTEIVVDLAGSSGVARDRGDQGRRAVSRDFTLDRILDQYRLLLRGMAKTDR